MRRSRLELESPSNYQNFWMKLKIGHYRLFKKGLNKAKKELKNLSKLLPKCKSAIKKKWRSPQRSLAYLQ